MFESPRYHGGMILFSYLNSVRYSTTVADEKQLHYCRLSEGIEHRSHNCIYLNVTSLPNYPTEQLTRTMYTQPNASCHPCKKTIADRKGMCNGW